MPSISVIIPVYNAEKYIKDCLRSILQQTFYDIEIICVNDGSTDNTGTILEEYAIQDNRLKVIHQDNAGAGAARNKGMKYATGDYYSFLDADDFFEPLMLEKAYYQITHDAADIVVFRSDFYNNTLRTYSPCNFSIRTDLLPSKRPFSPKSIQRDTFLTVQGWAWDKLFSASFIKRKGLLFQEQRSTNDAFFVFCAFALAERITVCDDLLIHHRIEVANSISITREKSWGCYFTALVAIREKLQQEGYFFRFEQDYINYALHFSLWHLRTITGTARERLFDKLKKEWLHDLGITSLPKDMFYHKKEYLHYMCIMKCSYKKWLMLLQIRKKLSALKIVE